MQKTSVFITTQKEFIHKYENAPKEVEYLRYPHRHVAHIKVEVEVFDDDREIEFIMLKHKINEFLNTLDLMNDSSSGSSCETIAKNLLQFVRTEYATNQERDIVVTVSEDGENGSKVYLSADKGEQV